MNPINQGKLGCRIAYFALAFMGVGLLSSSVLAHDDLKAAAAGSATGASNTASANALAANASKRRVVRYRSPARSGLLFSVGRSEVAEFDVVKTLTDMGYTGVTGGDMEAKIGVSLGYRQALTHRWSVDASYIFQNMQVNPFGVTVTAGTDAQAASEVSKALPKLTQGISLVGLYHVPFSPTVSVHLGGGAFIWKGERETHIGSAIATDKENGVDPMLQLGLGYRVSERFSVEGNVQRFFMPDEPINRVSLGMVYRFR